MTQPQPPITGTTHSLPFAKLSPRDFERLCLWLVERKGYECAEHLSAAGCEQNYHRRGIAVPTASTLLCWRI